MSRYSFLLWPLLLGAALQVHAAKKPKPEPAPSFESNVRVVLLDVVVNDSKGNPVTGLKQDDFRIFEDGKPQKIASFQEHKGAPVVKDKVPPLPKNTYTNYPAIKAADSINVILMDSLNTPILDQDYAHQQVIKYLKTIPPGARVAIFTLSSRLKMIQDFTTDSSKLLAVLNGMGTPQHSSLMQSDDELQSNQDMVGNVTPIGNEMADMSVDPTGLISEESVGLDVDRVNITLTAFQQLANYLAGFPGRKNLMWVSGSFPIILFPDANLPTPSRGQHAFMNDLQRTADLCTAAQIAIYPIAAEGLIVDPYLSANANAVPTTQPGFMTSANPVQFSTALFARQHSMELLAKDTGGQAFYNTNGLKDVLQHVTNEGMHYYTLTYTPTNTKADNHYRRTRVELADEDYKLYYRRDYYATDQRIGSGFATTRDPLFPLMNPGLPDMADLVYNLSVNPSNAKPSTRSGQMLTDFKGPVAHYALDFAVSLYQVKVDRLANGDRRAQLEVRAIAYDDADKPLSITGERGFVTLTPPALKDALKFGIHLHEEIDVPANAHIHLRTGVFDLNSGRAGTLGIRLLTETANSK